MLVIVLAAVVEGMMAVFMLVVVKSTSRRSGGQGDSGGIGGYGSCRGSGYRRSRWCWWSAVGVVVVVMVKVGVVEAGNFA